MGRPKRWTADRNESGQFDVQLSSWKYFHDLINSVFLRHRMTLWRGHSAAKWRLEPTLDRVLRKRGQLDDIKLRAEHFERFKLATRGRRGITPVRLESENEWWALGQHYGLATPLLDWTQSPFVALYFAFAHEDCDNDENRAVFSLQRTNIENLSANIADNYKGTGTPPRVQFIDPHSDENPRLVNQRGMFTRGPDGVTLEDWVQTHAPEQARFKYAFISKISIPNRDRENCLRALNRMNINHLSLFPDLGGSAIYSNFGLEIAAY